MSLINPINIVDARIDHIKSDIDFAVYNGSAENTFQNFPSNSQTNSSSIIYNVQVPSMSTIIDRNMMQQATIAVQIACGNAVAPTDANPTLQVPVGQLAFNYGYTDSLQAFPLNSLVTTQQATINNTTVTVNLQDVLAQLLRMYDNETLQRYNSTTPSLPDMFWKSYADGVGTSSNVLAGYNNAGYNLNLMPRGAYPVTISNVYKNGVLMPVDTESFVSTAITDTWTFTLTVTVTEPILGLSPFLHTDNNNNAGFVGINNMSLQFNLQQACNRFFSSSTGYISSISLSSVTNCKLLMNFLSLQPEQYSKISPRNVLPYIDLPRYLFNTTQTTIAPNNSNIITFSNIQLNQIPDLMIIVARPPMGSQNWKNTSSFYGIPRISMNFNNKSGILSSANQQQLYDLSFKNGSSQTFYEFAGLAQVNNNTTGLPTSVYTLGSLLILNPSLDFGLPSMLSGSSGGQFNLQFDLTVFNNTNANITNIEICLITINSGTFSTEMGTSNTNTGVLTREQVLDTKTKAPVAMDTDENREMMGGSLANIRNHFKHKTRLGMMGAVPMSDGSGMSGGGESGGVMVHQGMPMVPNMMPRKKLHKYMQQ